MAILKLRCHMLITKAPFRLIMNAFKIFKGDYRLIYKIVVFIKMGTQKLKKIAFRITHFKIHLYNVYIQCKYKTEQNYYFLTLYSHKTNIMKKNI